MEKNTVDKQTKVKEEARKKRNLMIDAFMGCSLMIGGVAVLIGIPSEWVRVVVGVMAFYLGARFFPRL